MYVLDFSLDNLSLMALILSIGFVVDDAIVMLENIVRHIESRRGTASRRRCAAHARSASPSSPMTLSLAAVFIPVLFMGGILGKLFREFAVTITVAILISGLVSISLDADAVQPLAASVGGEQKQGWLFRKTEAHSRRCTTFYGRSLAVVLRHRAAMAVGFFVVLGATFCPIQDRAERLYPRDG